MGSSPIPRVVSDSDDDDFEDAYEEESWDAMDEDVEEDVKSEPTEWHSPSCGSVPFHSRLGRPIDFVHLGSPEKTTHLQRTFAHELFGARLVMYKLDLTKDVEEVPSIFTEASNGYQYEILCSKYEMKRQDNIPKKILTLYYVLVAGPDIPTIHLQQELDRIANWGSLPPPKVSARLELLFSTAVKGQGKDSLAIYSDLTSQDFECIPEDSHVGCGFVPRSYLERFLGRKVRGARTFAIQVRVFSPELGVFKGMLVEKPGIDKIQLPPSMQKVGPFRLNNKETKASILINNIYPSSVHLQVAKVLSEEKEPPKSFIPNKLKWMIISLFHSLGVPEETIEEYVEESHQRRGKGLKHSCVVGCCDPTASIPEGHIFVTGVLGTDADLPSLFVTRFPCAQKHDGLLLPLLTSKPNDMTRAHWDFFCNLPFGAIFFGNAPPGQPSLPSKIARGDLDGDNYFICWNRQLLKDIQPVDPAEGEFDDGIMQERPRNDHWLRDVQSALSDVSGLACLFALIGKLCTIRKRLLQDCGPDCPDAEALGVAYKDSLEVAKHGKKVRLPHHLWALLPESVHPMLKDTANHQPACDFAKDPTRHAADLRNCKRAAKTTKQASGNKDDATDEEIRSALARLEEGAPVEIIGGIHETKTATFVRLTAKMVYVLILEQHQPPVETRLLHKQVRPARQK